MCSRMSCRTVSRETSTPFGAALHSNRSGRCSSAPRRAVDPSLPIVGPCRTGAGPSRSGAGGWTSSCTPGSCRGRRPRGRPALRSSTPRIRSVMRDPQIGGSSLLGANPLFGLTHSSGRTHSSGLIHFLGNGGRRNCSQDRSVDHGAIEGRWSSCAEGAIGCEREPRLSPTRDGPYRPSSAPLCTMFHVKRADFASLQPVSATAGLV